MQRPRPATHHPSISCTEWGRSWSSPSSGVTRAERGSRSAVTRRESIKKAQHIKQAHLICQISQGLEPLLTNFDDGAVIEWRVNGEGDENVVEDVHQRRQPHLIVLADAVERRAPEPSENRYHQRSQQFVHDKYDRADEERGDQDRGFRCCLWL
eukprot:1596570-Prymnesium_polylepis.1